MLDKYDAEGYRCIYVVREYMTGGTVQYEQVFGAVDENAPSPATSSQASQAASARTGNTYLYDGGILSNRRTGSVQTSATKDWDASAFQAEFKDVTVELTLQSRPAGVTPEAEWENTGTTAELDDFYAEHLTVTPTTSARSTTRSAASWNTAGSRPPSTRARTRRRTSSGRMKTAGGTFTLQQSKRTIEYRSTVQVDEESATPP